MKIKTRRYYLYCAARIAVILVNLLPIRFASKIAGFLGKLGFAFLKKERDRTLCNLRSGFKEYPEKEIKKIAQNTFSNISRNFTEFACISKINRRNIDLWVTSVNFKRIDDVLSRGKGGIILASHFGNWELLSAYLNIMGHHGPVIIRRIYFNKFDELLNKFRAVYGFNGIYRDASPKIFLKKLKENSLIGILPDQDIDSIEGIFVDFFGRPAYTPVGPVKIAMVSGAPLIPCFVIRKSDRYEFIVDEPIYVERDRNNDDDAVRFYTQKWTSLLESYIRKHPDQWVWMHKRWKTQPE